MELELVFALNIFILMKNIRNPHKSSAFQVESEVVELLGSELLVHSTWNDKEMISKISTGTLVKPHTTINLTFNKDKIKIFDELTGDAIKAN